jgi:probable selenium-dependent hydroxylase accessory protein YqeC
MLILLDSNKMRSLDGNGLIKYACDKLSEYGIENFIHWNDEISVDIAGESHGGKLTAPPQAQLERWMTLADIVLIEADGAKRMPCKAPAAHEPVLLPQCDTVLAVAGLSALRHPLREVCFRAELAAELLCVPQDAQLTPELLANLLASEAGGRKAVGDRSFYVVLNQADTKEQAALARQIADILKNIYRISCVTSHFEKGERA